MKTMRIAAVTATMGGVAVGLAGPASADPLSGSYTATVIDGGGFVKNGVIKTWTFTPCGPDCTRYQSEGGTVALDLHLQGDTWTGTQDQGKGTHTLTVDNNSLVANEDFRSGQADVPVVWQLAKNS